MRRGREWRAEFSMGILMSTDLALSVCLCWKGEWKIQAVHVHTHSAVCKQRISSSANHSLLPMPSRIMARDVDTKIISNNRFMAAEDFLYHCRRNV
jgi:hypothetical protein